MAKGFNRPTGMGVGAGGQQGMMQQLRKMQEAMEIAQAQLAEETVTSSVGGGAVKVTMTGNQQCKGIEIDPEMLQDLLLSAVNMALDKSREMANTRLGPLAGGLGL